MWVGDFNGDGKLDVLVQVTSTLEGVQGHNVYEFLGNGDGTFAAGKIVLQNIGSMNVADLNHDGIGDIVAMVEPLTTLPDGLPLQYAAYLGQQDGSFVLQNTYQLTAGVLTSQYTLHPGVMLGDFNGDGNIDIAAFQEVGGNSNIFSGQDTIVQILLGNGDGTFTPTFTTFDFNQFVVPQYTADLNDDGKSDFLELDGWGSAFQIVPAGTGPALQANILTYPIFGSTGTGNVTLALSSATDTTIQLTASDPNVSLPASITIPANSASQTFQFQIGSAFNPNHVFSIQASLGTQTATTYGWKSNNTQGTFVMSLTTLGPRLALPGQTTGDYGLFVSSIFDYSANVQLSCAGLPTWAACQFGQTPLFLSPGGSLTASWVITTSAAAVVGTYPFTVIATDGTVTEQADATFDIGDFGITITPSTATAPATGSVSYNLAVTSINDWYGLVETSVSGMPAGATVTCCLGNLTAGVSNSSLNIRTTNVVPGSYTFTVIGTVGSLTHSATASMVVQQTASPPSFTGSVSPASATLSVGQSANFNIALNSQNGATGAVTFQCLNVPSGTTCTFNPTAPTLPANGSVSDQLAVQVNSRPAAAPPPVAPSPWKPPGEALRLFSLLAALAASLGLGLRRRNLNKAASMAALLGVILLFFAAASCGGRGWRRFGNCPHSYAGGGFAHRPG